MEGKKARKNGGEEMKGKISIGGEQFKNIKEK